MIRKLCLIMHWRMQVETEPQMAYLHYRLQQCDQENALIHTAQLLASQNEPVQDNMPKPRLKPLQVSLFSPKVITATFGFEIATTAPADCAWVCQSARSSMLICQAFLRTLHGILMRPTPL